jgi:N-acetylglucosamine malate deacetylase 1
MFNNFKNILVFAPHAYDGELVCRGILKSINMGSCETYVAFSTAIESVPEGFPNLNELKGSPAIYKLKEKH